MASERPRESRSAPRRHGPSNAVEMGYRPADSVLRTRRTSGCVRESGLGIRQIQRLASPPIENRRPMLPLPRLQHYTDPQGEERTARCSRCILQPAGPIDRLPKK